jgi:histidyl-tRNA synthetase
LNKKIKLNLPRGIKDIDPEKYRYYLWIQDKFRELCKKYNYKVMEPATIEFFETLALKSGPDIAKEIYEFKDKAGRHLGLRFDLTVGLTRYAVSHPEFPKPIRLGAYSIQWRYDEPQFSRYRSFYAWDIEIYGGEEIYSSSEVILFVNDILSSLGLKNFKILISDRRLVENIIKYFSPKGDTLSIMRALDKWGKLEKEDIATLIEKAGGENIDDMFSTLFYSKENDISSLLNNFQGDLLANLYIILKDELGIKNVSLDLSVVRGLDYYDGIVFEVKDIKGQEIGSIVGGGSFSYLVKLFGGDTSAFGAAGGVERILLALEREGASIPVDRKHLVVMIPLEKKFIPYAIKVSDIIRRKTDTVVEGPVQYKSLKKYLQYVNKIQADYAVFIGDKEVSQNKVKIKDLVNREEYLVSIDEVVDMLSTKNNRQ